MTGGCRASIEGEGDDRRGHHSPRRRGLLPRTALRLRSHRSDVIRAISRVQASQQRVQVAGHLVVEVREGEGRLARPALEERVGGALECLGVGVGHEEIQAHIALAGSDGREIVMCLGAWPTHGRHAVDRGRLEFAPIRFQERPEPRFDRLQLRHLSVSLAPLSRSKASVFRGEPGRGTPARPG